MIPRIFPTLLMSHFSAIASYATSHILSIVGALVVSYIIGSLWHGPIFGKQWMALNKIPMPKKEDMKFSMMIPGLTANFALIVVQSAVLGRAFQILMLPSIVDAFVIAMVLWLPFTALVLVNIYAWSGKPVKLMVLDAAHALVSLLAVAAVLYETM